MCGIVGYNGKLQAGPILLEGLTKLEYRGYDSAGIAVRNGNEPVEIVKAKGRLRILAEKTENGNTLKGTSGIGHTRWATHGEPSENNAHPHCSDDKNVVGVHNGIIENYRELREKLEKKGYVFYSETDTEVAIKLVDYYYKKYFGTPIDALAKAMVRMRGSYALEVMFRDYPGEVYAARKDSPMIIGYGEGEAFIASDVTAILKHTRKVCYIDDFEMARLANGTAEVYNIDGDVIEKPIVEVTWDSEAAEKGGYPHFMLKEIHEQPKAVQDTLYSVLGENGFDFRSIGIPDDLFLNTKQIYVVACGSAYHAGVVMQYVIEDLARVPVRVECASEFRYRKPIFGENDLVIVISQSGETADSLAALREAKAQGVNTLAIVNVRGSSIAREADYVFYTLSGPEIAVATTKAYSAQLIAGYALAVHFAVCRKEISQTEYFRLIDEIKSIPEKITSLLSEQKAIQKFASEKANSKDVFFIGRGIDYATSMEGSLKLKEISYIHSEAYAAGELKHGTISLIENDTLVIGIATQNDLYKKTISNMVEVQTRGAYVVEITQSEHQAMQSIADFTLYIPSIDSHFAASMTVIYLQLFAYYVSLAKGLDIDKPRNLAKSVTVE